MNISFSHINLEYFLVGIICSFVFSLFPFFVYTRDGHQENTEKSNLITLLVLPVIVFGIMYFIGTSIALSIGLVGSLSIVRFRTAIKSPRDLIYFLWVISIGVGLGSKNLELVAIATPIISIFFLICEKYIYKFRTREQALFIGSADLSPDIDLWQWIKDATKTNVKILNISSEKNGLVSFTFAIPNSNSNSNASALSALRKKKEINSISFINES